METCDMHIHSEFSDGFLNSKELLDLCEERNLKKISITDHDCVDFYLQKENIERLKNFEYITGCEFCCSYKNVAIEIIGYGIDIEKAKKYLDEFGVTQNKLERYRGENIPKVFLKHGIVLDFDNSKVDYSVKCPTAFFDIYDSILKNKEAIEFLNRENPNTIKTLDNLLRDGINNPKSKIFINVNSIYPTSETIISKIKELGGLAFLAHPYQYKGEMDNVLNGLKDSLDGVECYHFTTTEDDKKNYLIDFCKKHNLMISGGSDFHYKDDNHPKGQLNRLNIPAKHFDDIKEKLEINKQECLVLQTT